MGARGPAPKRSEQRRRANKPTTPDVVKPSGAVAAPALDLEGLHPLAVELFESIAGSPEALFFTPAVWQRARVHALMLSKVLESGRPSSQMYAALQTDWKDLLVSPAEQRRLGIEVQRAATDEDEAASVTAIDDYQRRLAN